MKGFTAKDAKVRKGPQRKTPQGFLCGPWIFLAQPIYHENTLAMATVEEHDHSFLPESWPFAEPANTACYTNARLLESGLPIMRVFHDHDGEWQFLSGDIEDDDECKLICFGCIYERDNGLAILNSLPVGWVAERSSPDGVWECEPYEREDDGD